MLEVGKVQPGPTGNIQETVPCGTNILVNKGGELFRFCPIIFHRLVNGVVILGCLRKHGSALLPPCIGHHLVSHSKPTTTPNFCLYGCPPAWSAQQGWWRTFTSKEWVQHNGDHQQIRTRPQAHARDLQRHYRAYRCLLSSASR